MRKLIILIAFCFVGLQAQDVMIMRFNPVASSAGTDTTNWYVSNTGNDGATGHSTDVPLQTLATAYAKALQRGDTIFLKAGDKFRGKIAVNQSGTSDSTIVTTRYGDGADPIVDGSEVFDTWVQNGNIWSAYTTSTIYNVFINGVQQVLARTPNIGQYGNQWLNCATGTGTTKVILTGLSASEDALVNAQLVIRPINWSYNIRTIRSNKDDSVCVSSVLGWTPAAGYGAFIQGYPLSPDSAGEWCYDAAQDSLRIYLPTGTTPASLTIEGVTQDYGSETGQSYITFRDIQFQKQGLAGMNFSGTPAYTKIDRCKIYQSKGIGIEYEGAATNIDIDSIIIQNTGDIGIDAYSVTSGSITEDTLRSIGIIAGSSEQPFGILGGENLVYNNNYMDSVGYTGYYFRSHTYSRGNIVKHYDAILGDGGGYYSDNSHNIVNTNSFAEDAINFLPSNGSPASNGSKDIYFDEITTNSRADSIVSVHGNQGAYFQRNSYQDTLRYGMFYRKTGDLWTGALQYYIDTGIQDPYADVITYNTVYNRGDVITPLFYHYDANAGNVSIGTMDYNTYYNSDAWSTPFLFQDGATTLRATLAEWRTETGDEANSTYAFYTSTATADSLFRNYTNAPQTYTIAANTWKHPGTGTWNSTTLIVPAKYCSLLIYDTNAPGTVVRDTIVADGNDAESDNTYEYLGATWIGKESTTDTYETGLRFMCEVPQGSTIDSCSIELTCDLNSGWNPSTDIVEIGISLNDEAPIFVEAHSHTISTHLATLSTMIEWSGFTTPAADVVLTTPNLASLLQQVVDSETFVENNYVAFVLRAKTPTNSHYFVFRDLALSEAARLYISYH
jgi:hypothetical protein